MARLIALLLALTPSLAVAAVGAPVGANCNLSVPPAASGELMNHGIAIKVFPRARDISANYSGCQMLWAPDEKAQWNLLLVVYIEGGSPVRPWTLQEPTGELSACRYIRGELVAGEERNCGPARSWLKNSMDPGCVERSMAAGTMIEGCRYE